MAANMTACGKGCKRGKIFRALITSCEIYFGYRVDELLLSIYHDRNESAGGQHFSQKLRVPNFLSRNRRGDRPAYRQRKNILELYKFVSIL
ncbi:MAG: hypothetical protein ACREDT_07205 [Methylocella sp.]